MNFKGLHHIGLRVDDPERSLRFYTEGLGGKVVDSFVSPSNGKIINMVELAPGAVVELLPAGSTEVEANNRWAHIALDTEDIDGAFALAIQAGAEPRTPPKLIPLEGREFHVAFVAGPDMEQIEFFKIIPGDGLEKQQGKQVVALREM